MLDAITKRTAIIIECDELTMEFFSLLIENFLESIVFTYTTTWRLLTKSV